MAVKTFKPITPSLRHKTVADFSVLTPKKDLPKRPRALFTALKKQGGRNVYGRITVRHQGGGHKRKYRIIDFKRNKGGIKATVISLEYDPNRSAYVALLKYQDGEKRYILAPLGLKVGDSVMSQVSKSENTEEMNIQPDLGNHLPLFAIPLGTLVHNVEMEPRKGGKLVRAAGGCAQVMAKKEKYCQLKMPSGEIRLIHKNCYASIGQLSNPDHENLKLGKAGRNRWLGVRPTTRGVAMNPVDHPHGGGEGKTSGGGHPRSPWGVPTKGYKTRRNKRTSAFIFKRRR